MASQRSHFLSGKTVIIAGAGMAGLSFAIALRKCWDASLDPPTIRIYERDTREAAEGRQGYSLSLAGYDETGGLYALKQLGLLDEILSHAVSGLDGDSSFKLWNPDWSQILSVRYKPAKGLPSAGIRIARRNLRKVLLDEAEKSASIEWGTICASPKTVDNGRVSVRVVRGGDESEAQLEECDFLICADGSSSRLRGSLRPDDKLQYLGAVQLGGSATFEKMPEKLGMNWGVTVSNGRGVALFSSPIDDKSLIWSISRLEPEQRTPLDKSSRSECQQVLDECKRLGEVYGEPFPSFVANTDLGSVFSMPARDKQPFAHDGSLGPIAFIGDSNHAVSPFAGYGASLAMKDGWDLAEQICASENLGDALRAYDAISIPRAKKVLDMSHGRIRDMHKTGIRYYVWKAFAIIGGYMLWLTGQS
ncbi:hypothetical protein VUR80DRAFT_9334 [Thermomyces stellatus]